MTPGLEVGSPPTILATCAVGQAVEVLEVALGLGRIVALYYHSPNSHQIHQHIRYLFSLSDNATEP